MAVVVPHHPGKAMTLEPSTESTPDPSDLSPSAPTSLENEHVPLLQTSDPPLLPPVDDDEIPLDAVRENKLRKQWPIVLGIVLLVGYLAPVPVPSGGGVEWEFIPIDQAMTPMVPTVARVFLLCPILIGVAAIVAGVWAKPPQRGIILLCTSLIPLVTLGLWEEGRDTLLSEFLNQTNQWSTLISFGCWWALHIGLRIRLYRPNSHGAYVLAAIGGGVTLLFALMPFGTDTSIWEMADLMSILPEGIGLALILASITTLISALIAVCLVPRFSSARASRVAGITYLLYACPTLFAIGMTMSYGIAVSGAPWYTTVIVTWKFLIIMIGLFAFAPMGITDIALGRRPLLTGHCLNCDYDMRGTSGGTCPECGKFNQHLQFS